MAAPFELESGILYPGMSSIDCGGNAKTGDTEVKSKTSPTQKPLWPVRIDDVLFMIELLCQIYHPGGKSATSFDDEGIGQVLPAASRFKFSILFCQIPLPLFSFQERITGVLGVECRRVKGSMETTGGAIRNDLGKHNPSGQCRAADAA